MNQDLNAKQIKSMPLEQFLTHLKLLNVSDEFKNTIHFLISEVNNYALFNDNLLLFINKYFKDNNINYVSYPQIELEKFFNDVQNKKESTMPMVINKDIISFGNEILSSLKV